MTLVDARLAAAEYQAAARLAHRLVLQGWLEREAAKEAASIYELSLGARLRLIDELESAQTFSLEPSPEFHTAVALAAVMSDPWSRKVS